MICIISQLKLLNNDSRFRPSWACPTRSEDLVSQQYLSSCHDVPPVSHSSHWMKHFCCCIWSHQKIACNAWASCSAICCSWRKLDLVEVKIMSHFTSKDKCCHGCKLYTLGLNMQGWTRGGLKSQPAITNGEMSPTHVGLALLFVPWKHRSQLCSPNDFLKERIRGL